MKVGGAEWPRKAGGQIESEIWVQGRVRLWQSGGREGEEDSGAAAGGGGGGGG